MEAVSDSQSRLVLNRAKDPINGGIDQSEVSVDFINLNRVMGRIQLRLLLEVVLPQVLSFLLGEQIVVSTSLHPSPAWAVGSSSFVSLLPTGCTSGLDT